MEERSTPYRERRFTSRDNLSLYFRDYGDPIVPRAPLVCLAGFTRNSKDFHDLAGRLCADRRVVSLDYRGRGRSDYDRNWRNYDPRVYVDDVLQLLAATNMDRVVMLGTSLGGLVAMSLAVAAPTRLAGVILNDIGPVVEAAGIDRVKALLRICRPQPDWETATRYIKANYPGLSIETEGGWLKLARRTFREGPDGWLHFDFDPAVTRALEAAGNPLPDLWPLFRALRRVPTLAIRGAMSDILSPETFDRMAEEKPDLMRATVPEVGHVPLLDEPACADAIDAFLRDL